jgi:uncharacterized protein
VSDRSRFAQARIVLRPIGSPLTIGMSGLAIASLVQSGLDLQWIGLDQTRDVGLILIAVPFVLQIIACVFSYLARDGAAGAAIGVLAASWLAMGLLHAVSVPGSRSGALGLMLLAAGASLALSAAAVGLAKPLPGIVFLLAGLRFIVAGIYELGAAGVWQNVAGVIGLILLMGAAYCVLAFELEGQQHHAVLPTFRRGVAQAAPHGDPAASVGLLTDEAGVRQTS